MVHDVLNLIQLFSIRKIGKNHNELICPLLITVVVIIQLLQTRADTIGYIHRIHLLFMHVMDKLDMIAKAKNHAEPENIQKQEKSYSRRTYMRNKTVLTLFRSNKNS
jgi:hypothetical protein